MERFDVSQKRAVARAVRAAERLDDATWELYATGVIDARAYVGQAPLAAAAFEDDADPNAVAVAERAHRVQLARVGMANPAGSANERTVRKALRTRSFKGPTMTIVMSILRAAVQADAPNLGPIRFGPLVYDPGAGPLVLLDAIAFNGTTFNVDAAKHLLRTEDDTCAALWNGPETTNDDILTALALNAKGALAGIFNLRRKTLKKTRVIHGTPSEIFEAMSKSARSMAYFRPIRPDQGPLNL